MPLFEFLCALRRECELSETEVTVAGVEERMLGKWSISVTPVFILAEMETYRQTSS